jgi:hypothetical protein
MVPDQRDPGWEAVDQHLFDGHVLLAVEAAREQWGPSMGRALRAVRHRLTYLAGTRPDSFRVPLARYGRAVAPFTVWD